MTTVTLSWDDPEDAAEFLTLRAELVRDGWLPDPSAAALLELVAASIVADDSGDAGESAR